MCGPVLGIAGAAIGAVTSIMQANAQAAGMEAQADYNERQAVIEGDAGAYEGSRIQDKGNRLISAQITGFTANGINPNAGSAVSVASDSLTEVKMDVAASRYGASIRSSNFKYQSSIDRMNADLTRSAGPINALSGIVGAFGSMAPTFSSRAPAVNVTQGIY
jgi:hypothetical protein